MNTKYIYMDICFFSFFPGDFLTKIKRNLTSYQMNTHIIKHNFLLYVWLIVDQAKSQQINKNSL